MHLCTLCIICNITFLTSQKEEHERGGCYACNEFKSYKNTFFDLIVFRKKKSLLSNKILRVSNKKEMKALKQHWNIIGVLLSIDVNVGIEV